MSVWDELIEVASGAHARVLMTKEVAATFDKFPAKVRASMLRLMEHYAASGPEGLPPSQFKFEGHFVAEERTGKKVGIYAFKGWQKRLYGGGVTRAKVNNFISTEVDDSKKQDKADQAMLRRSAKKLAPYLTS